jgi:hypothetical protein
MPQSLLGQQLIELTKSDYPDDYARACRLACAIEGPSVSPEEAMRLRLRAYRRYDLGGYGGHGRELDELNKIWEKSVEHFANVFRNRLVGRRAGHSDTEKIPPDLVRPDTLHFDPDEVKTKDGVIYVDVRIEPDPQIPNQPISQIPDQGPLGRKPGDDWSTAVKKRVNDTGLAIMRDPTRRPTQGHGQLARLAERIRRELSLRQKPESITKIIRGDCPELSAMIPKRRKRRNKRKHQATRPRR